MSMRQYLLPVFLLLMVCVASAKEEDFDLVGQLRISAKVEDKEGASVINCAYFGLSGFAVSVPLNVATLDKELLARLSEADGKWVGLCGVWEQRRDAEGSWQYRSAALRPSSVAVLGDGFRVVGQIIKYTHPDASMGHIKHAIVDCHGHVFPLRFAKGISVEDLRLDRRVTVRGTFHRDGHKGFLMCFEAEKIEETPKKPDAGDGK